MSAISERAKEGWKRGLALAPRSLRALTHGRVRSYRRVTTGLTILLAMTMLATFADLVTSDRPLLRGLTDGSIQVLPAEAADARWELWAPRRFGPNAVSGEPLAPPTTTHLLGTDEQGRDVLARAVHGARNALLAGTIVAILGAVGGALAGAISGYYAPRFGRRLERIAQSIDAFPALIVVALVRTAFGASSTASVVLGAALVQWATVARLVRSEVQRISAEDFVLAAKALGASRTKILHRHVLPHLGPSVVSSAAFALSAVVVLETALAFLDLGPPIQGASWGEMLAEGARHPERWGLFWVPSVLLWITVGAAYLIADGLRDASDPAGHA